MVELHEVDNGDLDKPYTFCLIQEFIFNMTAWSIKTFGNSRALPVLRHLQDEVKEVIEAVEFDYREDFIREEFADCFILLLQAAQKSGISFNDLFEAAKAKFEINQRRVWQQPDSEGRCHHID